VLSRPDGTVLTQREYPALSLVNPQIVDDSRLILSAPGKEDFQFKLAKSGSQMSCSLWGDESLSVDQGDDVAAWFSSLLKVECRLLSMADDFVRAVDPDYATGEQEVGFADGFPFLLISEASLNDLNDKLEFPVPMNRFRPNIVVSGCAPFAEDKWKSIRISGVVFDLVKPCARCVMVTIDQDHAVLSKEPLRTLAAYRKVDQKVMFGQNLVHHSSGCIRVGDQLEILALHSG
ncbi:MAG: MOSC domain-containing protein, partial [Candidatus Obscuribacterales bacterium]|nr:MOSC domain-containing protein [Candidatus Obscuribacterales bacterium]